MGSFHHRRHHQLNGSAAHTSRSARNNRPGEHRRNQPTGRVRAAALPLAVVLATVAGYGCAVRPHSARPSNTARTAPSRHPGGTAVGVDPAVRRTVVLGYSIDHRPIVAEHLGDPDSHRRVLVVGCIHGSEPAGIAIARALSQAAAPPEVDLWVVAALNPDGVAAHRRGNARGVDLNRNFPDRWQRLGPPGTPFYSGRGPLSEPESRIAAALLRRLKPTLGVWYHQALDVVDNSQGPRALERRYSADTGLPLRPLPDYPGSAVGYENQQLGPTAFVVELPPGPLAGRQLNANLRALLDVASGAPMSAS